MTFSMVEKARNASSAGNNRAHSNRRNKENEYSNDVPAAEGRVGATQPIYHRNRQRKKLLCLWRIWAHGLTLPK